MRLHTCQCLAQEALVARRCCLCQRIEVEVHVNGLIGFDLVGDRAFRAAGSAAFP